MRFVFLGQIRALILDCATAGCQLRLRVRSFFELLKKDSATAVSQQLPSGLMMRCRLCSR